MTSLPIPAGAVGVILGLTQAIVAIRGTTRKSVLLRGIPALVLEPLAVLWLVAMNLG